MKLNSKGFIFSWQSYTLFFVLIGLFGVGVVPARAAEFTVSTAAELIAAIETANGNGQADMITLSGDILISNIYSSNLFFGAFGLPLISSNITINGNGFAIERDNSAPYLFRVISINGGTLTINDATIGNGFVESGLGGGNILVANNGRLNLFNSVIEGGRSNLGGGIHNFSGSMNISNSTLQVNATFGPNENGGALYNRGVANITNSTIYGNLILSASGAGIYNTGTMTITNSTISENISSQDGAGIYNTGTLTLNNVTISENTSLQFSSGIYNTGTATVSNSIISGNFRFECVLASGIFNTNANNLFGVDNSNGGCPNGPSDIVVGAGVLIEDILAPIADNGGPTLTHALITGSPAVNASGAGSTVTDQRGVPIQGAIRDIGAFELGATEQPVRLQH